MQQLTKNPISVRAIDHVVLRVRDIDESISFYRDVIGCPLEKEQAAIGLYQLRAGSALIDLVDVASKLGRMYPAQPDRNAPNMDHVCLQVEPWNPDAIAAHLRAHGVQVGQVERRYGAKGNGPSLYIDDPDGNVVELKGPPDAA